MALDQFNLNNLPAPARHCLYIVLILALAGMWFWIYQKPRNEELASINSKNDKLRVELRRAETVKTQYEQYQRDLRDVDARLIALQSILPTEKEAAAFLRTVQEMAGSSNLKINQFRPRALVAHDFYFDWPVEVKLEGNYHGLGRFFESLGQAQRIVDVPSVTISNISNQTDPSWTLSATGTVRTYVQGDLSGQYQIEEE